MTAIAPTLPAIAGMTTHTTPSLCDAHAAQLKGSAIADEIIAARGYVSIVPGAANDVMHLAGATWSKKLLQQVLHGGALMFPIHRLADPNPYTWVLRPDLPRHNDDGKVIKYEWPRSVPNVFDVLPRYRDALNDPTIPIWLTEGTKKADALASAFGDAIVPINMNGVYGWRGKMPNGGTNSIPDFDQVNWIGRSTVIAPDGDTKDNPNVMHAVRRLARVLLHKGAASVLICYLPQPRGGPKVGIDDYLAQGHTITDLESLLVTLDDAARTAHVPFRTHAETGEKLYLPPGYDARHQTLVKVDPMTGRTNNLYAGDIYVKETGANLVTGEQSALVVWNGRGDWHGQATVPYTALSDTKTFSTLVGAAGAALGPRNIKDVQQFLVEFVQENRDALPHRAYSDRLGLVEDGLVTPAGAVGLPADVRYTGHPAVAIGQDADAYLAAIRAMLQWDNAWPAWLALGLSLAAPAIARLRLRRNPVLYIAGESGSGKTTIAQFATGAWGEPTRNPLRIEGGRTTPAGVFQTLETISGLPLLIDEAHTVPDPKRLEMACYGFANGQTYTRGGVDGHARGGDELRGVMLLAGEALPDFKHAGSHLRVLWIDASAYPPLGAPARSTDGQQRAATLEAAWNGGAGLFGKTIAERIWGDWPRFVAIMRGLESDPALAPLGPWREPLAAAAAALNIALEYIGATMPDAWGAALLDSWAAMLLSGHKDVDPITDAWERLVVMLAQGRRYSDADDENRASPAVWEYIAADHGGGVIACKKLGEPTWRVLSSTPQFRERVGETAVQLYGQNWMRRGWVLPGDGGKATAKARVHTGATVRVLRVPEDALLNWGANE